MNIMIVHTRGIYAFYLLGMFVVSFLVGVHINVSAGAWIFAGAYGSVMGHIWFEGRFGMWFKFLAPFVGPVALVVVAIEMIQQMYPVGEPGEPWLFKGDKEVQEFGDMLDERMNVPEESEK